MRYNFFNTYIIVISIDNLCVKLKYIGNIKLTSDVYIKSKYKLKEY